MKKKKVLLLTFDLFLFIFKVLAPIIFSFLGLFLFILGVLKTEYSFIALFILANFFFFLFCSGIILIFFDNAVNNFLLHTSTIFLISTSLFFCFSTFTYLQKPGEVNALITKNKTKIVKESDILNVRAKPFEGKVIKISPLKINLDVAGQSLVVVVKLTDSKKLENVEELNDKLKKALKEDLSKENSFDQNNVKKMGYKLEKVENKER